jgi:hypothetical protein
VALRRLVGKQNDNGIDGQSLIVIQGAVRSQRSLTGSSSLEEKLPWT